MKGINLDEFNCRRDPKNERLKAAKSFYHGVLEFPIVSDSKHIVGFDTGSFTYFEPWVPRRSSGNKSVNNAVLF